MPKAVIFDCYNTLLRYVSDEQKDQIWEMMLTAIEYMLEKTLGIMPEELEALYQDAHTEEKRACQKQYGEFAEMSLRRVWKNTLLALDVPYEIAEEKAEDILLVFRLFTRKKKALFPNVQQELEKLKMNGIKLLLLSNAQTCFIYNELPLEIRELFDEVIISEVVGIMKPSEEVFRLAFEKLGVEPKDIVFVGDSAEDDMIPSGKFGCGRVMIGKERQKISALSNVNLFNPYRESGYTGLAEMIIAM